MWVQAWPTVLAAIQAQNDQHDGYPTSTIGSSPPTPGPPILFEGTCREIVAATKLHHLDFPKPVYCGAQRPCREHDTHVHMTSVESAAIARKGNLSERLIRESFAKITAALDTLEEVRAKHTPRIEVRTCNRGTGREGYIEWCDPLCDNIAEPDRAGLCMACAKREYRWRKDRGLPSRNAAA